MPAAARALRAVLPLLVALVWVALPALAAAAAPSATPVLGADTRSAGAGPGFVGSPGVAILAVLGIGLLALLVTLAYVRLSGGRRRPQG